MNVLSLGTPVPLTNTPYTPHLHTLHPSLTHLTGTPCYDVTTGGVCVCQAVCPPREGPGEDLCFAGCSLHRVTSEGCCGYSQSNIHPPETAACRQNGRCECVSLAQQAVSVCTRRLCSFTSGGHAPLSVLPAAGGCNSSPSGGGSTGPPAYRYRLVW